jgi:hypothetical protein
MKPSKDFYNDIGGQLIKVISEAAKFSNKTFGDEFERGPEGPINHLKKEVNELLESPLDRHEYADCFLLLVDAYRRAGGNIYDMLKAVEEKIEINKNREWGSPDENGIINHIR